MSTGEKRRQRDFQGWIGDATGADEPKTEFLAHSSSSYSSSTAGCGLSAGAEAARMGAKFGNSTRSGSSLPS